MDYLIDTDFLIGRWRSSTGAEQAFIEKHPDATIGLPWVVKAEFLRGVVLADHELPEIAAFLEHFPVVWPDEETIQIYARTYSILYRNNQMIGPHDLWIASSALRLALPLLTGNTSEFHRVADLMVQDYRSLDDFTLQNS
jgi:predicted nucleic acid-binding protein